MESDPLLPPRTAALRVSSTGGDATTLLRDGRVLAGEVLARARDGTLTLAVGRTRLLAESLVALEPGDTFLVRVEGDGPGAVLRLLGQGDPSFGNLLDALRGLVGEERTVAQLLGDLATRLRAEAGRPGALASELRSLLEALPREAFAPDDGARGLADVVARAAGRYEALLAAAVKRGSFATEAEHLRANLKARLLDVLGRLEESPSRELVKRLLSAIESEQLLNLARRSSGEPLLFALPFPDGAGWTSAQFLVERREEGRAEGGGEGSEEQSLVVEVNLSRLGPVRAAFTLARERLTIRVDVAREDVAERLRTELPDLTERLSDRRRVVQLAVRVVEGDELARDARARWDVELLRNHHLLDLEG